MSRAVCLVDTSIFVEILNVPGKASQSATVLRDLETKITRGETLLLPMATIFETGNHIAQNGDGRQRRKCALKFVDQVEKALKGVSPFSPVSFPRSDEMLTWLSRFPDSAMRGGGFGDLSIIRDYERACSQNPGREVYIWSLDVHLQGYRREPTIG